MINLKDSSDTLVISYEFPPSDDINGIVLAKRIINGNLTADVIQNKVKNDNLISFDILDDFITTRLYTTVDFLRDSIECIFEFLNQGLEIIENRQYSNIYSSSWAMANHFLALEYKLRHPDVFWTAEFSDPLTRDLDGKFKVFDYAIIDNEDFINELNSHIKKHDPNLELLRNLDTAYFIAEYMTYIFADELVFTNVNQKEIMSEQYGKNIKELIESKATISPHPTLENKYYHLKEKRIDLNTEDINIAYFGNYYYAKRHFEPLFYAYESLNHKFKDRIKFHIFINEDEFLYKLIDDLEFKSNITIQKPLDYFEFLNASTQYDILLINDTTTKGNFKVNPYLPSKLSDYKGSGRDIWALYEEGSILSGENTKYKSPMNHFAQSRDVLVKILKDYGYDDEEASFDDGFLEKRITDLNEIIKNEDYEKSVINTKLLRYKNQNKKLKKQIKKLKAKNEEPSKSPKITNFLKGFRK